MSISSVKQTIEVERLVGSATFQIPVRAETLVPGAGRESVEVIMEDAFASVSGAEAQNERVLVSGQVQCQAVYRMGSESSVRALTARGDFEQTVDMEGVTPRMTVRARAQAEHAEAAYDNGHMVFQITVTVWVRVRSLTPVEAVSQITGQEPVETLACQICSTKTSAENSETAQLSDSVSLPAALHARVVLMQWAAPRVDSAARDLGGVRLSGEVQIESLIASSVAGRPVALVRYQLPFEQLVAMPDWIEGNPETDAEVSQLSVEVEEGAEGEDSALKIQCALLLTVRLSGNDCISAVSDAYLVGAGELSLTRENLTLCAGSEQISSRETFRGAMLLPENAPGAGTALAARIHPVVSGWETENGSTKIEGLLEATVLYMPSGSEHLTSARSELPFAMRLAQALEEDADVAVSVSEAEATALMSDRMELRCVLSAKGVSWKTDQAVIVTEAEEGEGSAPRRGVGVYYPAPGDSFWTIGRKYHIALDDLKAANPEMEQASAGNPVIIKRSAV